MNFVTSSKKTRGEGLPAFAYFVNYIFRSVIPVRTIGNLHDGCGGLRSWLIKNCFNRIFDFSTQQVLKIDSASLDIECPDAVVAYNPFHEMGVDDIGNCLDLIGVAKHCAITAIPTGDNRLAAPQVVYRVKDWVQILSQMGSVVEVYHCDHYSLFLVVTDGRNQAAQSLLPS